MKSLRTLMLALCAFGLTTVAAPADLVPQTQASTFWQRQRRQNSRFRQRQRHQNVRRWNNNYTGWRRPYGYGRGYGYGYGRYGVRIGPVWAGW